MAEAQPSKTTVTRTPYYSYTRAGFTGFKTAAVEELNDDVTVVMDAFHVVRLAGHGLEQCRRRIQLQTRGHRGRAGEPLYSARRALSTGADLLTDKQRQRITDLFANDAHLEVETTWGVYQAMIGAYRDPSRTSGKAKMQHLIDTLASGVPAALTEVRTLGRTLKKTGRRHLGLLRPARHQQRTHRGDQCTPEIPLWFCPRVPQPHQLHRQVTAGNRWVQTRTTPSNAMSRFNVRTRLARNAHRPLLLAVNTVLHRATWGWLRLIRGQLVRVRTAALVEAEAIPRCLRSKIGPRLRRAARQAGGRWSTVGR